MYRILLADDEPWALYGLQNLIHWEGEGFTIVDTAMDGLTALDKLRTLKPDLLISDIRMPGLDGLELIRQLKDISPATAVVLITGYSDFAYAQEALRRGVFDYLVKQVKKPELIAALHRVREYLDSQAAPQDGDLYFTLFDDNQQLSVADCVGALGLEPAGSCCILTCLHRESVDVPLIGPTVKERGVSHVSFRTGSRKVTTLMCFDSLPQDWHDALPHGSVGSSDIYPISASFAQLYNQSETAMLTAVVRGIPMAVYTADPAQTVARETADFVLAFQSGNRENMLRQLASLRQAASRLQFDTMVAIANRLVTQMREQRFGAYEQLELHHEMQMSPIAPLDELFDPLEQSILSEENGYVVPPSHLRQILRALDEQFTQNLHITDLAKQFYISANYLSILLKRETNYTFTELLIRKRIALAQKLLAETALPIQEIVEQVGYKEYSSFIRIFKKHVGMTPYAYRKNAQQAHPLP